MVAAPRRLDRVTRHDPCPVCGRADWCSIAADRSLAICMRFPSDRPSRNGGYVHRPKSGKWPGAGRAVGPVAADDPEPAAPPGRRDAAYRGLMALLPLSSRHRDALLARGFSAAEVDRLGYGSLTGHEPADLFCRFSRSVDRAAVPGFHRLKQGAYGHYWSIDAPPGLLVPCLSPGGLIRGIRVRPDEPGDGGKYRWLSSKGRPGGASSGVHCHVARPDAVAAGTVWVTEGEIKADLSAARLAATVLSIPGVSSWARAMADLAELLPGGGRVVVALDMDWRTKPQVHAAAWDLAAACAARDYAVEVATWDGQYKGLDDALAAGARPDRNPRSILTEPKWTGKLSSRVLGPPLTPVPGPPVCDLETMRAELALVFREMLGRCS